MYRVDVYLRVRRAVMVDGMSMREASRGFGLHRDPVRKMLAYSVPPGYRRQIPPKKHKLKGFTRVIDRIPDDDSGSLESSGTPPSTSSNGCGTSKAATANTPSTRTTSASTVTLEI